MFCYHGGGQELLQETFDTYADGNVKVVGCGAIARESFTSKIPIRGIEDLKGVKVRSPEGLAATVFERAGASPVALPSSEVYTSLDKGVIDASDFSSYTMDESIGLHEIAKFPIYPGIHSMPVIQLTVNKAAWESLTPAQQTILDVWYRAMIDDLAMINEITDRELVARDSSDGSGGVEVIDWSKEDRDQLRQIAAEAWADFAEGDELAKRAYEANIAFMKKLGLL
jgi:TRAP-type mannitol/chloroaromatic compound transport system substrate-binding protein